MSSCNRIIISSYHHIILRSCNPMIISSCRLIIIPARRHPEGAQETLRRHPGGAQKEPRRHPAGTQEAPRETPGEPRGHQKTPRVPEGSLRQNSKMCLHHCASQRKVAWVTVSQKRGRPYPQQVRSLHTKVEPWAPPQINKRTPRPSSRTARTLTDKSFLGKHQIF